VITPAKVAALALEFSEVTEEQPFGPQVEVYKVLGKIFAILAADDDPPSVSLKCEPDLALALRDQYPAVTAGYHLNKKHWNTVVLDGSIPDDEIAEMIDHSYQRVAMSLPKAVRSRLS
jgi:predicted DNA-binding protein (MmcQ/YjbR family)